MLCEERVSVEIVGTKRTALEERRRGSSKPGVLGKSDSRCQGD
jgi:hypothetical protein